MGLAALSLPERTGVAQDRRVGEAMGEQRIRRALGESVPMEFIETPLRDVVDYLKDAAAIPIEIDAKALEEAGLTTDTPMTRNLKGVTLRSGLRVMLRDLDLAYLVDGDVLVITTAKAAALRPITRVYPVANLLPADAENADELVKLVRAAMQRPAPEAMPPTVAAYGPLLIVRDTEEGQTEVERLLAQIAAGLTGGEQPKAPPPPKVQAPPQGGDPFAPSSNADPFGAGEAANASAASDDPFASGKAPR
jgi:hypothetical protein